MGIEVTHYDQTASGLIQAVPFATVLPRPRFRLQNVGEIANRGWEMRAFARRGAWHVNGTLAIMSSRVAHVSPDYAGDLRTGDRMLAVPARTMSIDATYRARKWTTTLFMARAFDWLNYDRIALIEQDDDLSGPELREYWRSYSGHTHVRAVYSRLLENGFTVLVTGNNLLNRRMGEPDNLTVMPGRTLSLAVRAAF
jgi:iron complex outermembrane receptor protein